MSSEDELIRFAAEKLAQVGGLPEWRDNGDGTATIFKPRIDPPGSVDEALATVAGVKEAVPASAWMRCPQDGTRVLWTPGVPTTCPECGAGLEVVLIDIQSTDVGRAVYTVRCAEPRCETPPVQWEGPSPEGHALPWDLGFYLVDDLGWHMQDATYYCPLEPHTCGLIVEEATDGQPA